MSKYPEHDKISKIREKSQAIGEFLEWLQSGDANDGSKIILAVQPKEYGEDEEEDRLVRLALNNGFYIPFYKSGQHLIAKFFGIDVRILEKEQRDMINELRDAIDE